MVWIFISVQAKGYDEENTHPRMTESAIQSSKLNNYLMQNLGFSEGYNTPFTKVLNSNSINKRILQWLSDGSKEEDAPLGRASNHFHNPLKPWDQSYVTDSALQSIYSTLTGWTPLYSNITWATGYKSQTEKANMDNAYNPYLDPPAPNNWDNARIYYFKALTRISPTGATGRETAFAQTFQALGQVIHLLEDMAVPAHVRNDFKSHLTFDPRVYGSLWPYNPFEFYVKTHDDLITGVTSTSPTFANLHLTDFWDTEQYTPQMNPSHLTNPGLAEYTNANFVSDYTFSSTQGATVTPEHYFDFPSVISSVSRTTANINDPVHPGTHVPREYWEKTADGDTGYLLAGVDYLRFRVEVVNPVNPEETLSNIITISPMDDNVHKGYADRLLSRAVGYSAALLNYFFRGTLEISAPSTTVYSVIDGSVAPQQFTKIKAKVKNTTLNENIGTGTLQAVARYKIIPNYVSDLSNYPPDGAVMTALTYSYSVSTSIPITSLSSADPEEFTFVLSSSPIPAGITDLTLQVVFKGTLGNEIDNSIAVGMKDLLEPTHLSFWNLTEMFSLDYHLYLASMITSSSVLSARVDLNNNQIFGEEGEPYIYPYPITFNVAFSNFQPTALLPSAATATVPAGRYIRLIALVDGQTTNYVQLAWDDIVDSDSYAESFVGGLNQSDEYGNWLTPTPSDPFRYSLAADGVTRIPIVQHHYIGVLSCEPASVDEAGNSYCSYPEEESVPADVTPYPATINFP